MRPISLLASASLAALLAACAQDTPTMVSQDYTVTSSRDDFAHQATIAPVQVVVHGRGAGLDHQAMVKSVADALQGNSWGANASFVAQSSKVPATTKENPYAMIFMINGPSDVTGPQLCAEPATRAGNSPIDSSNIHLIGALCRYDQAVSDVEAKVDGIQGMNDPKLKQLIASASRELTTPTSGEKNYN